MHFLRTITCRPSTTRLWHPSAMTPWNSEPLPSTPLAPTTPEMLTLPSSSSQDDTEVGEDVIRSLVTPSKSTGVREVLEKEKERHRCALKLLPFFFTLEELSNSNTEGTQQTAAWCYKTSSVKGASFQPISPWIYHGKGQSMEINQGQN